MASLRVSSLTIALSILLLYARNTVSHPLTLQPRQSPSGGEAQLLLIAPTATSCTSASFPLECATASTAFSPLIQSFSQYSITTAPEQAALLSWIVYESGEFKFDQNHFPAPGNPGQGTRTMMMPNFVAEYVQSIPALASGLVAAQGDVTKILDLVENDTYDFGSAAWFYATQCTESVKDELRSGGQQGWEAWLTQCVGVSSTEGTGSTSRLAYWQRAVSSA